MKVQLYVGGTLAYDNRLPEERGYKVFSIAIDETVNKGGTAKVILPPKHPAYDSFSPYSVPVEVYRDGKLRWRGRPIPPATENIYRQKTVVCEGELCFLQDAIHRPYSYAESAASVFTKIIGLYNTAVEPWKRFVVGDITVTGDVVLSSKNPENALETVQHLIELCGGFIFFDSLENGSRRINWYKDSPFRCNQTVCYGYNMIDCSNQTKESEFATRIIPYGAADKDGVRIKIDVDGRDYVENKAAIAEHGVIEKAVIYNDISDPAELKIRAESDVAISGLIPATIQINAIDMSRQDISIDAFAIGQQVPAESAIHKVRGNYFLMSLSEDLVNPQVGKITLVRELTSVNSGAVSTLTGAIAVGRKGLLSAAGDNADLSAIGAVANLTQEFIFNKLTNNGDLQGIYMLNGQIYTNASYMKTGTFDAKLIKVINLIAEKLKSVSGSSVLSIDGATVSFLSDGEETVRINNQAVGLPIMYMHDYVDDDITDSLELSPHHMKLGGTSVNPVISFSVSNGVPSLSVGGIKKTLSWQQDSSGKFVLTGT